MATEFMRKALPIIAFICCGLSSLAHGVCPDLSGFYIKSDGSTLDHTAWDETRLQLHEIFDQCLLSSVYFALYGAPS